MCICKFCLGERKNKNSLINHERLCKNNPDKQTTPFQKPEFQIELTKNGKRSNRYIKAILLGKEKPVVSLETKQKISQTRKNNKYIESKESIERKKKIINEKVSNGTWHTSLAKRMHHIYKNIDLHGMWEVKYAQWLDLHNIKWIRCKNSFKYVFENKVRHYTPDFYLIDTNEYIEIKGYKTSKDDAKWSQFPINEKLIILMEKELKDLDII
jgi:hypothetical protein